MKGIFFPFGIKNSKLQSTTYITWMSKVYVFLNVIALWRRVPHVGSLLGGTACLNLLEKQVSKEKSQVVLLSLEIIINILLICLYIL